jgi:translation initiation factor 6
MKPYLAILRQNLLGSPNIGVYALTTNSYTILPFNQSVRKINRFNKFLGGQVISTTVGGTRLIGVLAVANSNGIVLPNFTLEEEIKTMKSFLNINVERIEGKLNAYGNLILVNDYGGIVGKNLIKEKNAIRKIEDVLDIELVQGKIAGLPYVGSLAAATNTGVLTHPLLQEEESKLLEEVLKVRVDLGTVNGGNPFVSSGLLVNDSGVIIGQLTTGPEIMVISNLFGESALSL